MNLKEKGVSLAVPKSKDEASQNWKALMAQTGIKPNRRRIRDKDKTQEIAPKSVAVVELPNSNNSIPGFPRYSTAGTLLHGECLATIDKRRTWCLAMDCEMVGVGPMNESALARVSIVNEAGYCILDTFVKPKVKVTDYRTEVSGVRESDLVNAENFDAVVKRVANILDGRIVVGHSLEHDFKALLLCHPKHKTRDTSIFYKTSRKPSLKFLAQKFLNIKIQEGEHNSILDAQVAMKLYLINRKTWEEQIRSFRLKKRRRIKTNDEISE